MPPGTRKGLQCDGTSEGGTVCAFANKLLPKDGFPFLLRGLHFATMCANWRELDTAQEGDRAKGGAFLAIWLGFPCRKGTDYVPFTRSLRASACTSEPPASGASTLPLAQHAGPGVNGCLGVEPVATSPGELRLSSALAVRTQEGSHCSFPPLLGCRPHGVLQVPAGPAVRAPPLLRAARVVRAVGE